jgi:DNA-binding CsgD family transcriptional regulator
VTEGIDSNDTSWELIAHVMSIVHEQYLWDLAANVARGQEGALIAGFSVGDYSFGFTSVPVPGSELGRRGRDAKPRKIYVVDPETAPWVARIFHWFVRERQSLRWIARELNRLGAPKDHRATTKEWRHQYLTPLLKNQKYIGEWDWGKKRNVRDLLTGKVRQEDRAPEEYEQWRRHRPHLQIVDDETFAEAQRLLEINREAAVGSRQKRGRLNGSEAGTSHVSPRHLLSWLIVCGHCGRTFHVGGTNGRYLFCPGYRMGTCSCQTQLRRDRAERMILGEIGRRILADPAWRQRVLEETLKAWNAQEATIPTELAAARRNLVDVEQKIANLVDRIENGRGGPELDERLAQRRAEKRELTERVKRLEAADQNRRPKPTEAWVEEQLRQLGDALSNGSPAAAHALRDLVGGQIVVTEVRQPGRERHYLQGRFTITSMAVVTGLIGAAEVSTNETEPTSDGLAEDIVIDFRKPPEIEAQSERAKQLYDQGMMNAQIAQSLGCSRSRVTALLKFWFESRGLEMPDGRTRRASLKTKHVEPPLYQKIADQVMALWQQQVLLQDIADRLQIDRNTVTSAVRWWHEVRNLPVPDGRTRRKELDQKTSPKSKESDEELPAQPPEDKLGHEPDEGKDKH